jgi:hypothetical protein
LSTGRLSGTGFAFDVSGTNAPRLALRDLTNGAAGVEMFANDYTTGGGTLNLRSQGADGIPQVQIRSSGTRGNGGGQITLTNQFSTLSTCVIYGDTGDIINSVTSSNSIGGITLSSGFLYGLNLNTARSLLNYIVLGVVYDSASNHLYNIYYTGSNGYIDIINSNKCYTLVSAPRTKFQFYSGLGATGSSTVEITSSSFTSESSLNFNSLSPSFESNDRSYRAYFF